MMAQNKCAQQPVNGDEKYRESVIQFTNIKCKGARKKMKTHEICEFYYGISTPKEDTVYFECSGKKTA